MRHIVKRHGSESPLAPIPSPSPPQNENQKALHKQQRLGEVIALSILNFLYIIQNSTKYFVFFCILYEIALSILFFFFVFMH